MKLAVVFDDLIQFGGAERLLLAVLDIWDDPILFAPIISKRWQEILDKKGIKYKTSFLQKFPFFESLNKVYAALGLHILGIESFDFSSFDVVLSISSRYAHGVITKPQTKHICYMNSPGRMYWEPYSYFDKSLKGYFLKNILSPFLSLGRMWDLGASKRVDLFVANSFVPQKRIKKYYGREAEVIYPFLDLPKDVDFDDLEISTKNKNPYFLFIGRLNFWKRVDVAIEACILAKKRLVVVGTGPLYKKFVRKYKKHENIEFKGFVSEQKKWSILKNCSALIHPQLEDFGMTPLESLYVGKPVIAYGKGGVLETITPKETGEFFYNQKPESLEKILRNFDSLKYSSKLCNIKLKDFTKERFEKDLSDFVNRAILTK